MTLCFAAAIIFSIVLIFWWRSKRRNKIDSIQSINTKYTGLQKLGMICIIVFLVPIFFLIFSYIAKGAVILFIFLFQLIRIPESVILPLLYIIYTATIIMALFGTYYTCEFIWPKKYEIKE